MALAFVNAIISWIIGSIVNGVLIKSASDLIENGKTSLSDLKFVVSKLPSLLVASLIVGILVMLGLLLLIIPGIIILLMFYLVIPVVIIEKRIEHLPESHKSTINKIIVETIQNFSDDTSTNINLLTKAFVENIIHKELAF